MVYDPGVEVRQLRYALLVAEELHFGRAAERAFITQSALSQQIARLERSLGTRLFDRGSTGVRLTAAGERFVERAAVVLTGLHDLQADLKAIADGYTGLLRIGLFGAAAAELTPLIMGAYREALPSVAVEFHELSMTSQAEALTSGTVDVALLHPLFDDDALDCTPLIDEPRCAAVPAQHELAAAPSVSVRDLADEPFVTARSGTPGRWRDFWTCGDLWGAPPQTRAQMSSVSEGLAAVAHLGVVDTVPSSSTRYYRHPGVAFVPLSDASYSTVAVARRRGDPSPAVTSFVELAVSLARQHHAVVPGAVIPPAWPARS